MSPPNTSTRMSLPTSPNPNNPNLTNMRARHLQGAINFLSPSPQPASPSGLPLN
ncbi:hypothetical protein PCANC_03431 [Puccinia coronata f. sp. avenae]|uniref:Uncharacterized protein n=1 Tax=Puccinia coronata f. sp. avenae TaxID=200324 RepID=A0A2N5W2G2_9BASI|nr:hypothetical protein PCANC_03431 [Puccinia coronata f. sp. avenae]